MATSQHVLPLILSWATVHADPHCPAQGCAGLDHGRWDAGLPTWTRLPGDAQGSLGKVLRLGRLPLSSRPPAPEGKKTPLAQDETFLPTKAMGPWQGSQKSVVCSRW